MKARQIAVLLTLGLLLIWELLFYLRVIDSSRFSHPLGTIEALRNFDFVREFGRTLVDTLIASFSGTIIALTLAVLIAQSSWAIQTAIRFLRLGIWAPFFIFWAVPYWLLPAAVTAVSLFACYKFLSIREGLSLPWLKTIAEVQRQATLQALLFYLLFEIWSATGWMSLGIAKVNTAYAILVLLLVFAFSLDRVFRSNFSIVAEWQRTVLVKQMASGSPSSYWTVAFLILVCLLVWQLLSEQLRYLRVAPPLAVVQTLYPLLASGEVFFDIVVSLMKIFVGLFVAGWLAVFIVQNMSDRIPFRNVMSALLAMTFIVPIMLKLLEIHWVGWDASSWFTSMDVGLLTFYPFVQALWALRDYPRVGRILLAADQALPYAFLAMLFGEAMSASRGLGFYIVVTRNISEIDRSLGGALLTFLLLILVSAILRSFVKRYYFFEGKRKGLSPITDPLST